MWSWTVRVQPSDDWEFEYMAVFLISASAAFPTSRRPVLEPRYLYGRGDLAVFLEDLGASQGQVGALLDDLGNGGTAEMAVEIGEEAAEVLWSGGVRVS